MNTHLRTGLFTSSAMIAFAANSLLCRLALGGNTIDPASFTAIRLASGAIALWLLVGIRGRETRARGMGRRGDWVSAAMLFLYAIAFSVAYVSLSAGIGALLLFGAVQATMVIAGVSSGERPHAMQWAGLCIALAGLVYLVLPGLTAPPPAGAGLMAIAGIAWGVYSLRGRGKGDPVAVTTDNFIRSVPLVLVISLPMLQRLNWTPKGLLLATISGSLTSGMGYVIWYAALPGLSATRAATVQLSVPVLAALGGVILLSESISLRLVFSAVAILGGVLMAVLRRETEARAPQES